MSIAGSFTDPMTLINPSAFFKSLRDEKPVYFDEVIGAYIVSKFDDVGYVLATADKFSNARALFHSYNFEEVVNGLLNEKGEGPFIEVLPMTDPPVHTRVRRLVNTAFSVRRIAKFQDYIEGLAERLIDKALAKGEFEFVADIGVPLPVSVIADMLCVPEDRVDDIKRWTRAYTACAGNRIKTKEEALQVGEELAAMQKYIIGHIKDRRDHVEDDVLGDLVSARTFEGDDPLTDREIVAIAAAFLVAGHETSTIALTAIIKYLAENPEYFEYMRGAEKQDEVIRHFCEEIMRLNPPVRMLPRVAIEDVDVGGVTIPKDSFILALMASANEDVGQYGDDAANFCPGRKHANKHYSFGAGPHLCVGNMLARTELKTFTKLLLNKVKAIKLADSEISLDSYEPVVLDINIQLKKLNLIIEKL